MSDKNRFRCRRVRLKAKGLCVRCATLPAVKGHVKCEMCAREIGIKKMVAPSRRVICEKRARLERNRTFAVEAIAAIDAALAKLG